MTPLDWLILEIIYSIAIAVICLATYIKTQRIYSLSKHSGIFHFRNIFLYFAISYIFRFLFIFVVFSHGPMRGPMFRFLLSYQDLTFLLVGYFSTLAVFSVVMTIMSRKIDISRHNLSSFMHIAAIILSVFSLATRSADILVLLQTAILIGSVMLMSSKKAITKGHVSKQNRIIITSLLVFWIINLLASSRFIQFEAKASIYIISALIFLSIYLKVKKRLISNDKKKK
ncbi:MAG: hypothetical protein ABIJ92_00920 [Candidatus Aenigmatarchaeota archaeon]